MTRLTCRRAHVRVECTAKPSRSGSNVTRRTLCGLPLAALLAVSPASLAASQPASASGPVITQQVYLDLGICENQVICSEPTPYGRVTLGLYGDVVPITVSNFLAAVNEKALVGTLFTQVLPGQFIQAGKQGLRRMGYVERPAGLQPNPETFKADAFQLSHLRPGTLSLALSENDDEPVVKRQRGYVPLEFMITTGPGPALQLDGSNIVFGRVVEGLEVVQAVARLPTFETTQSYMGVMRALNQAGTALGDQRAERARRQWRRPSTALLITDCGVVPSSAGVLSRG